jgi:hypothetical protein
VRNAAALTFTALVMRVIGFKNAGNKQLQAKPLQQLAATPADLNLHFSSSSSSAAAGSSYSAAATAAAAAARSSWCVKSPTAADFFYRYPQLHVFLLGQLQEAAELLQGPSSTELLQGPSSTELLQGPSSTAAVAASGGASSQPSISQTGQVPPSLFPVLVILSRLKPSLQLSSLNSSSSSSSSTSASAEDPTAAAAAAASSLAPVAFVPAVLAVGRSSVMGVRQIAAASLAPLVAADQLPAMCLELASSLPDDSADAGHAGLRSQNVLHGTLLQLAALLRAVATSNAGSGSDSSAAAGSNAGNSAASANVAALVVDLLPAFVSSSSSGSSRRASGAVRQAYIAAAGQLVILAYTHWPALLNASSSNGGAVALLQQLVSSLKLTCLAAVQQMLPADGSNSSSSSGAAAVLLEAADPQHCCWLRDCTMMMLGHLLRLDILLQQQQQQQQCMHTVEATGYLQELLLQLQQQLPNCIASSSYEVRAAALKAAAVQLDHVLQLTPQLPGLLSSGSTAAVGALQQLSTQLWTALEHEKTVKVLKRQLVVLGQLQSLLSQQPAEPVQAEAVQAQAVQAEAIQSGDVVLQRLRASLAVGRQYKQLEVRIAALTCAAREVHPAVAAACQAAAAGSSSDGWLGERSAAYLQYMQQLLQLIHICSQYGQQEELRAAAADALQLSGLLQPLAAAATRPVGSSSSSAELLAVAKLSLSAWSVALRLMEDEEDMVRQPAADAAQQVLQLLQQPPQPSAMQSSGCCIEASGSSSSSWGVAADPSGSTGQYVEAVEQSTFDMLARCSSRWPDLLPHVLQLLTGVVFEAGTAVPEVLLQQYRKLEQQAATASPAAAGSAAAADAASGVIAGVLVRRLFEKEADNHHEEPVLLAQHAAAALQRTLQQAQLHAAPAAPTASAAAAEGFISSWCAGLAKYLGDVVGKMSAVSSNAAGGWVGGDTNHPEVFVPLYRCLLGLLAAAPWWAGANSSSSSSGEQLAAGGTSAAAAAAAAAAVKSSVKGVVGQLLQLQPTVLLLPVLQELQCAFGNSDRAAACTSSRGVLFLTQRQ